MKRFYLLTFSLLVLGSPAFAQLDTAFLTVARQNLVSYYNGLIRNESALFTGSEYKLPPQTDKEYPFFVKYNAPMEDEEFWKDGNIVFNQERYENVPVLYDLTQDMVIIENWAGDPIMLVKEKVSYFSAGKTEFLHLRNTAKVGLPRDGFYELLYDGPTRIVGRHSKTQQERIENRTLLTYYTYKQRHYLLKNGVYHSLASKGDLFKLLADRKTELRDYVREQKIKISKKDPSSFARVAAYYDTITAAK
jgi:hypothetical protein